MKLSKTSHAQFHSKAYCDEKYPSKAEMVEIV